MRVFDGQTADEVWQSMAEAFRSGHEFVPQSGRNGVAFELMSAAIEIADPRQRWVLSRQPYLSPAFSIAEVVWIVDGRNDLAFLNAWNSRYKEFVGPSSAVHGAYGHRLRVAHGLDQLLRANEVLSKNPDSRQVVLQIWNPANDLPRSDGSEASEDVPCNICAMVKLRGSRLTWTQIVRSNDLFLGVPVNFVQFTFLQEIVAGWLGADAGVYRQFSDSLHVYEHDSDNVRASVPAEHVASTDDYRLPLEESRRVFKLLAGRIEALAAQGLGEKEILGFSRSESLPSPYANLLAVMGAERAARRKFPSVSNELIARCTNPALVELWARWRSDR